MLNTVFLTQSEGSSYTSVAESVFLIIHFESYSKYNKTFLHCIIDF